MKFGVDAFEVYGALLPDLKYNLKLKLIEHWKYYDP
jgi:hypothetical protein